MKISFYNENNKYNFSKVNETKIIMDLTIKVIQLNLVHGKPTYIQIFLKGEYIF